MRPNRTRRYVALFLTTLLIVVIAAALFELRHSIVAVAFGPNVVARRPTGTPPPNWGRGTRAVVVDTCISADR